MSAPAAEIRHRGWCPMCRSRCGCISTVRDGRLVAVAPDPAHPTGRAICAKGRAAPELVYSADRVLYPMRRTRPKGAANPGWQRIGWDEALTLTANAMQRFAQQSGPQSLAFALTTPSGTSLSDGIAFVERLMRAYGSPNNCYSTEICNWHKDVAFEYTFGAGIGSPDFERTGCVLLWGHNPNVAWLTQATCASAARARGARLIVIDPRRVGPAAKADHWLRVRPGTDGALALALAGVLLERGSFDATCLRAWSNGPFLVREDTGCMLSAAEAGLGRAHQRVVLDRASGALHTVDPAAAVDEAGAGDWDLDAAVRVHTVYGDLDCRSAFARYRALCLDMTPERAAAITGVPAAQIRAAAHMLWEARPLSLYAWSGVGQHTNATQTARAISLLYALIGSYDAPGGNLRFTTPEVADVSGREFVDPARRAHTIGHAQRPLGPARDGWITSDDLYRAILDAEPYRVRGLLAFGANPLVSHADVTRGERALAALEFHAHADPFVTPTARYADVLLPVCSGWERHALRAGFEMDQAACELVQYRQSAIAPLGESRSDEWIAFALAERLGLGEHFWHGDADAAYRQMLAPSGLSLEALRAAPQGIRVPLSTRSARHRADGGFATPSRRIEIWSEQFQQHGQAPLPHYEAPAMSHARRPELRARYPLVLTCSKSHAFCHSQHRNLPSLRRLQPDPRVEMHPDAAAARGLADGDWAVLETPAGQARARVKLRADLAGDVVAAQHGWWQGCSAMDLPERPISGAASSNYNLLISNEDQDPISGSVAHRSYLCQVRAAGQGPVPE